MMKINRRQASLPALGLGVFLGIALSGLAALPVPPPNAAAGPPLRGITANVNYLTPADVARFQQLGINLLTVNLDQDAGAEAKRTGNPFAGLPPTKENPLAPYARTLARFDALLAECEQRKLKLCLKVSRLYGMSQQVKVFWQAEAGPDSANHLVEFWRALARRYKDHPQIIWYEILSEPTYPAGKAELWQQQLLPQCIAAIRAINREVWLVVEPGPWGLPGGFKDLPVIKDDRVIYSFHHYGPHNYTHNFPRRDAGGKLVYPKGALGYPGQLKEFDRQPARHWDKAQLRAYFQPAIDFQQQHGGRMFVGEFSVSRWAPGRERWLADSIALFEELGWDWSFFSLTGWNGFNPTFPPDAPASLENDGGAETECFQILKRAWARNSASKGKNP